jgi:uncharacterized protein (DUF1501 family)
VERRTFLKCSLGVPIALWASPLAANTGRERVVILIELKGGNDGLNTVVPWSDPQYYRLRPKVAVSRNKVIRLDERIGLHPSLRPWMDMFADGQIAIVQGVGYDNPNRSHFRSMDIWETGSDSRDFRTDGWIHDAFKYGVPRGVLPVEGVVLDSDDAGPLAGERYLAMKNPKDIYQWALDAEEMHCDGGKAALKHIVDTQNQAIDAVRQIRGRLGRKTAIDGSFPRNRWGKQLSYAAQIITADVPIRVIKLSLSGFDTHVAQPQKHARLLTQLAGGIESLRRVLQASGHWDSTLVLTYSEFGRRPAENGGGGTDHGTAAPHFVLGGSVRGGLYGEHPSLSDLRGGDLRHHVNFRRIYSTVVERWWYGRPLVDAVPLKFLS